MQFFFRLISAVFTAILLLVAAAFYFLQDANRLKPEVQALLSEQTGKQVTINGDLGWVLLPAIAMSAQDLQVVDAQTDIRARGLELTLDVSAMWQDPQKWKVKSLHLVDTRVTTSGGVTDIAQLDLLEFQPGEPADFFIDATYTGQGADRLPVSATARGQLIYQPGDATTAQRVQLIDTVVDSAQAKGVCQLDASENQNVGNNLPESQDTDLLPLATLWQFDVIADCKLNQIKADSETFTDGTLKITNLKRQLNVYLDMQDFMGGQLFTDVDVDLATTPIRWQIRPEIAEVDSKRLLTWAEQTFDWVALLAVNGDIEFSGNSQADLYRTIKANNTFDAGAGEMDISALKAQLQKLAAFGQKADSVAQWPDRLKYEELGGNWRIDGAKQVFDMRLDNLLINARGTMDYATQQLDLLADVTIGAPPAGSSISVNPLLQDTPIPLHCTGPSAELKCRLDEKAAQKLLSRALTSGDESGLRKKLEQKIEEDVPEEYRDTARSLLDILGRALDQDK